MGYLDSEGLQQQIQYIKGYLRKHGGIPVGHEYFSVNPNIPQGSLPLFGGEYSRETYADLWTWVQAQSGYLKTEAEWQTLSTSNNGNVPYYSDGDGSTTFRVPSLKCWVKGANGTVTEVGSYKAAGLPNITGVVTETMGGSEPKFKSPSGAFAGITSVAYYSQTTNNNSSSRWDGVNFNASRSSSIYGNSATVQPESIVGMWLVKAYGTVEDTGTIDEQQYIDDRIAALPTSLASTFLPLAGGEMGGDVKTIPAIMSTDWGTTYQSATAPTSRWGVKGTLPVDRNICLTMAVSRDDSDKSTADETCRYGLLETAVFPDGSSYILLRGYKNATNSYDFAQLIVGYDSSQNSFARVNNRNIETVNSSGSNYIRYSSGIQICWGSVNATTSGATITFGAAFKDTNYIIVNEGVGYSINAGQRNSGKTTTSAVMESSSSTAASVVWIAIGWWQ